MTRSPLSLPKVFAYLKGKLVNSNHSHWENFNSEANGDETWEAKHSRGWELGFK